MAVTKITYAASTSITCTLASLAASTTAGRSCAAIDNSTNLYDDVLVTLGITTGSAVDTDKAVFVYLFGSEDGTLFEQEEGNAPGTDAAYTINNPTVFRGPVVIPVKTTSKKYVKTFSVAQFFGGVLPKKWGFIVVNDTSTTAALDGTEANHTKQYTGITYTTA